MNMCRSGLGILFLFSVQYSHTLPFDSPVPRVVEMAQMHIF